VYSSVILGCGGAGVRFGRFVAQFSRSKFVSIDRAGADIVVNPNKLAMVPNLSARMLVEVFPWVEAIDSEVILVIAGLGGVVGTGVAELVGRAFSSRRTVIGMFTEPFSGESPSRVQRSRDALERMLKNYSAVIPMSNAKIADYYPNLAINDAMNIHPIVLRHLVQDFERMLIPRNYMPVGRVGVGVGFGVGKERIRLAIEDALDSPWLFGTNRAVLVSGDVEHEDVELVLRDYDFEHWELYRTGEYGEQIKATVLGW